MAGIYSGWLARTLRRDTNFNGNSKNDDNKRATHLTTAPDSRQRKGAAVKPVNKETGQINKNPVMKRTPWSGQILASPHDFDCRRLSGVCGSPGGIAMISETRRRNSHVKDPVVPRSSKTRSYVYMRENDNVFLIPILRLAHLPVLTPALHQLWRKQERLLPLPPGQTF